MGVDQRLLPDRPVNIRNLPRILAHTVYSDMRDHRKAPEGPPPPGPVFIIGSPRSGTTFLGATMAGIPGTTYQFEPVMVKASVPYIWSGSWSEERSRLAVTGTHRLLKAVHRESRRTLIEKTPRSVFIIDRLARWYPSAKFLALIRDGRDVAASWARKPWFAVTQQGSRFEPGGYRYGPRAHFWVEQARIGEFESTTAEHRCLWGWRRHVEQWLHAKRDLDPGRYLEIRYEELVGEPERASQTLSRFLELDDRGKATLERGLRAADPGSIGSWSSSNVANDERALSEGDRLLGALGYT